MALPAVLLALGVGVLIGRAIDDDPTTAASRVPTEVQGKQFERTTTTTEPDAADEETTTTTAAVTAEATTTTVAAVAQATATTAPTRPSTTTTARPPSNPACGSGAASAGLQMQVTGDGPPSNPRFTYAGTASVVNNTSKAIELDQLVLRISSTDGTNESVAVPGAAGAVIEAGATRAFNVSHTTAHPPKDKDGVSIAAFSYGPPNSTVTCAAS